MSSEDTILVGYTNGKHVGNWNEETAQINSFKDVKFCRKLTSNLQNVIKLSHSSFDSPPLPIQKYVIKPAMAKEDINCISATGTYVDSEL